MDRKLGILNVSISILSRVILLVSALFVRRLLIRCIGNEVNGLNSLYSSIIGMLTVAELGVGNAIVFSMYRPIVARDKRRVAALYCLYKKLYRIIGAVIFVAGLLVIPFLPYLVSDYGTIFFWGYYVFVDEAVAICFEGGLKISRSVVFIITLNQFIQFMRHAALLFRDASGAFYYDRWKPVAEGVVNLTLSLIFVKTFPADYRVVGVIAATIITNLLICHIVEPYVLFKHVLKESCWGFYVKNYALIALFVSVLLWSPS